MRLESNMLHILCKIIVSSSAIRPFRGMGVG